MYSNKKIYKWILYSYSGFLLLLLLALDTLSSVWNYWFSVGSLCESCGSLNWYYWEKNCFPLLMDSLHFIQLIMFTKCLIFAQCQVCAKPKPSGNKLASRSYTKKSSKPIGLFIFKSVWAFFLLPASLRPQNQIAWDLGLECQEVGEAGCLVPV